MGLSGPRSNKPVFVGSSGGGQEGGGLWRAHGAVKPGVRGGWRVGAGVLSAVFLLEQELESGPLYPESSPASSKHPRSSHCECFPGASRRCVSSSTEPISCCLSLSHPLSFDFHLQNSRWPLPPPSPIPVLYYTDDPSCSSFWRHLHSWPTAQLLPIQGGGLGVFLLEQGLGRKAVLLGSQGLHHKVHPFSGGLTRPFWPLFGNGGLWSQDPALDNSKGDRQEACHRHPEGRPQGAVAARSSGWEEGWAWTPSSGLS